MTDVMDRSTQREEPRVAKGRSRFPTMLVAVLVVAVAGLGMWVAYDLSRGSGTSLDAEVQQVLDDYLGAWEAHDRATMQAVTAEGFLLNEYIYEIADGGVVLEDTVINNDVEDLMFLGFLFEWEVEQAGDAVVTGDGPWFVSIEENWSQPKGSGTEQLDGIASYTIVEEGDGLKIANHTWFGLRYDTE
jgi:hypothetical protein